MDSDVMAGMYDGTTIREVLQWADKYVQFIRNEKDGKWHIYERTSPIVCVDDDLYIALHLAWSRYVEFFTPPVDKGEVDK